MPNVLITDEAMSLIRQGSDSPAGFRRTGVKQASGQWLVPLGDDTLAKIKSTKLPGETISETIIRGLRSMAGAKAS